MTESEKQLYKQRLAKHINQLEQDKIKLRNKTLKELSNCNNIDEFFNKIKRTYYEYDNIATAIKQNLNLIPLD